jgi:hypothetical protein
MAEGDFGAVSGQGLMLIEDQEVEEGVSVTNADGSSDG